MIGTKQASPAYMDNYFRGFRNRFPNPERRRLAAKTLFPDTPPSIEWQYATRTVLAAQWADTESEALRTARLLYSLEPTLTHYMGQSVLRLSGASMAEIKAMRQSRQAPAYGLTIDIGRIDTQTAPEYAFRHTSRQQLPAGVRPDAQFLDFQVSLPVVAGSTMEVSADNRVEIYAPMKERADFVAYVGTVCLERDEKLYHSSKRTEVGNLAFGNSRSFGTIYDVLKSFGGMPAETFGELLEQREVSPAIPLPDIAGLLAAR